MKNIKSELKNSLKESANIVYDEAHKLCRNGVVATNCVWYHSAWQYFRMLNLVSTPVWHNNFYKKQLKKAVSINKNQVNVLISGTADYSILAYVLDAASKALTNVNIDVLDSCKTPLFACQWFADKKGQKINIINENILNLDKPNYYDLICTDAFLTRFSYNEAKKVVNKWKNLLTKNGRIVTTVRVHSNEKFTENELIEMKNNFIKRARKGCIKMQKYIKFPPEKIADMARIYTESMGSNNLGGEKEILELFADFEVQAKLKKVAGEYHKTTYLEIMAKNS